MTAVLEQFPAWVPDPQPFSSRLAAVRHAMGWNAKEAAIACRVAPQSWREWEDGRLPRDFETACAKIADRTGCDLIWLKSGYVRPGVALLLPRMDSNHQPCGCPRLPPLAQSIKKNVA